MTRSDEQEGGLNNSAIAALVSSAAQGSEDKSVDSGGNAGPANHLTPESSRARLVQEAQGGNDSGSDESSNSEGRSTSYLNGAMRRRSSTMLETSESQRHRITSPNQATSANNDINNKQSASFYGNKKPKRPRHPPPIPEAKKKERLRNKPPKKGFR